MIKHFDHVTIVVRDTDRARSFFEVLGFHEDKTVVISGDVMSHYMGVQGIEAEHHTLVLEDSDPRLEVQLLRYLKPDPIMDSDISTLREIGFNHICFAVDDINAEIERLAAIGFHPRNEIMEFHDRKLVFISGPEDITVELAQWQ